MDYGAIPIFIAACLMMFSMLAGQLSKRLGAPVLLAFLAVGMLFSKNGPGSIYFNDYEMAFNICSVALAVILFDGGLRTPTQHFQHVFKPALSLAVFGVAITAMFTGLLAMCLFGMGWLEGMLLGSIVASTDAAAVFLLLHQRDIQLRKRLNSTLEVESGINDPMAIFLTISCVTLMKAGSDAYWLDVLILFIRQMSLGLAIGYAGGQALSHLVRRVRFGSGLYPVVVLTGGVIVFGGTSMIEGSGFLAAYIAGVTFTSEGNRKVAFIKNFHSGMAWIAQLVMLLSLGLLVTPTELVPYVQPALLLSLVLIVLARPLAVLLSLLNARFDTKEKLFISWVGLRGAMPLYLALIPLLMGVDDRHLYFNIAFIIVTASLILQGWTINPLARRLGVAGNGDQEKPPL